MKALYPSELYKHDWRVELFLNKYKNGEPFTMLDGSLVTFDFSIDIYNLIASKDVVNVKFESDGQTYRFGNIGKSEEFGGGSNNLTRENHQIQSLNDQIKALGAVELDYKGVTHTVVECQSVPGTPKADFQFINENGDPCLFVSHKHGDRPEQFQQWCGMSERKEPLIHHHQESQDFIGSVKDAYADGLMPRTSLFRRIKDTELPMLAAYGNEYASGICGINNVNWIVQGDTKIRDRKIIAHHVYENGNPLTYSYEPVFTAIYKNDRADAGIKSTRLGIAAIGSRVMTAKI